MPKNIYDIKIESMESNIEDIKSDVKEIKEVLSHLDDRYPTRREVRVIVGALGFVATILGIIATILGFMK